MKVYVVTDMDMHFINGVYATLEGALKSVAELMHECFYERCIVETVERDREWIITFPHDEPDCVGHIQITCEKVEA